MSVLSKIPAQIVEIIIEGYNMTLSIPVLRIWSFLPFQGKIDGCRSQSSLDRWNKLYKEKNNAVGQISSPCENLTLVTLLLLVEMMMLFMLYVYDRVGETVLLQEYYICYILWKWWNNVLHIVCGEEKFSL